MVVPSLEILYQRLLHVGYYLAELLSHVLTLLLILASPRGLWLRFQAMAALLQPLIHYSM